MIIETKVAFVFFLKKKQDDNGNTQAAVSYEIGFELSSECVATCGSWLSDRHLSHLKSNR